MTFTIEEMQQRFRKFGTIYSGDDIREDVEDIIGLEDKKEMMADFFLSLKKYGDIAANLKAAKIAPNFTMLLYGPPGTGKTLTAKVMSSIIGYPLVYVRFESVISSYLGETASNLRKIFDYMEKGKWVVLFDEFDIIGKQRDDPTEHGEIKRVVNNFMLMLENYEGDSMIMASTNHPHLLDIGVWRRFDEIIYFGLPDKERRKKIFEKYLKVMKKDKNFDLNKLSEESDRFSGADIEQVCIDALKMAILRGKDFVSFNDVKKAISKQKQKMQAKKGIKYE